MIHLFTIHTSLPPRVVRLLMAVIGLFGTALLMWLFGLVISDPIDYWKAVMALLAGHGAGQLLRWVNHGDGGE